MLVPCSLSCSYGVSQPARRFLRVAGATAFVAGAAAALGSSVVKVPLAVCIRSVQAGIYKNVVHAAQEITKAAGVRGLFTVRAGYAGCTLPCCCWETARERTWSCWLYLLGLGQAARAVVHAVFAGAVGGGASCLLGRRHHYNVAET